MDRYPYVLVLLVMGTLSLVNGHKNIGYSNRFQISPNVLPTQTNLNDRYDSSDPAVSSRFDSGFSDAQLNSNFLPGGIYPGAQNKNNLIDNAIIGSLNSYDGQSSNLQTFHRNKRALPMPNVHVNSHHPVIGNPGLHSQFPGIIGPGGHLPSGDFSVVDKQKSNIGKGLAENERLSKLLYDIKNGGDTLVAHGEVLDMNSHPIGKALSENERLTKILHDIHIGENTILVRGSQKEAMQKIRNANAQLRSQIAQARQQREQEKHKTMMQIRAENARLRKSIALEGKHPHTRSVSTGPSTSFHQSQPLFPQDSNHPTVIDQYNPIDALLDENQALKSSLPSQHNPGHSIHGKITYVDKFTSNIGKGLAENERLRKVLHGIQYGSDTLVVHGEVLDLQTHRIGKGLSENERLNMMLNDLRTGKDKIPVYGSPREAMLTIRKANAALRVQIANARKQKEAERAKTLMQVKEENAKLRAHIAIH